MTSTTTNSDIIAEKENLAPKQEPIKKSKKSKKKKKKVKWKEQFNITVLEGQAAEKKKDYLNALHKYVAAIKISKKEHLALNKKINKMQSICLSKDLQDTAEAMCLISGRWYQNVVTDCYHIDAGPYRLCSIIYERLFEYQRESMLWLWDTYCSPNGGLLGDDMGLGKTVQTSAFLSGAFLGGQVRCVMLIVPVSVMGHWTKELGKWCGGHRIAKYHSSITDKRRQENLELIAKRGGVLITSYGMVERNYDLLGIEGLSKGAAPWDYMILDEGHMIKNHTIGTAQAVRQIAVKNSNKIILSGTFLQNELSELWSLFDFTSEGALFGTFADFNDQFANKINEGRMKDASAFEKQRGNELTNKIKEIIAPYLLRRTKASVIANQKTQNADADKSNRSKGGSKKVKKVTPILKVQKRELAVWIKMNATQIELYRAYCTSAGCSHLSGLSVLKKICDHPFLLSSTQAKTDKLPKVLTKKLPAPNDVASQSVAAVLSASSKMSVLLQLLRQLIAADHRILVFSQFQLILAMLAPLLEAQGVPFVRMDGSTNMACRQKLVDGFNRIRKIKVFLLSAKVGGLGLNLTGADRVIIFDPAWNPATDAQAVDRAYRIGQTNDVMVYRFVTCGTIEERMYRRQIKKVALLKSITNASDQTRYFSDKELKDVFTLENPLESRTHKQLESLTQSQPIDEARSVSDVAFDKETDELLAIEEVFGVSRHDLLFGTSNTGEIEEGDEEAASHIESAIQALGGEGSDDDGDEKSQGMDVDEDDGEEEYVPGQL